MTIGYSPVPPQVRHAPLIPSDVPVYRVLDEKGFYVEDCLYPQDTILVWKGEPNPKMDPLNQLAEDTMVKYLTKLDECGKQKAKIDKKAFRSELDAFVSKRLKLEGDDNRRVRSLTAPQSASVLSTPKSRSDEVQELMIDQTTPVLSVPYSGE